MTSVTCTMVGASYRPSEARDLVKQLDIGSTVALERDAENEYDDLAVKVMINDTHVGFIPKTDNAAIAAALDDGEELSAEIIGFESTIEPILEIELP